MPAKHKIKKVGSLFLFLLCLLSTAYPFANDPAQADNFWSNGENPFAIIYIIEFRDILCSSCGESLLDFCLSLPFEFQKQNTWGIVVLDRGTQSSLGDKIIAKKVRGFQEGNQLHFSVVIDFSHMFESLRSQASQLLFLDSKTSAIRKYGFPLGENQKAAILQAVLDRM